jgi:diacylglycerol kinase family enzyme
VIARRPAAVASIALAIVGIGLAIAATVETFPRVLIVIACLWIALWAGWFAIRHEDLRRLVPAATAAAALVAAILLIVLQGRFGLDLLTVLAFVLSVVAARAAFRASVHLPTAPTPRHPVLFFNPASGGGKALKFHLGEEARARGIEPIELHLGEDLAELVERAVEAGADALAMAGGDGSQAIVAELAARHDLPYACIPAGTRNHFALDLGVDRDDVVGSLDALVDGGERRVDLAEVNGRVFVNNVSLGFYAAAVQRDGYREAKLKTMLEVAPAIDDSGPETSIRWDGPEGAAGEDGVALLVSNDPYRLGTMIGSGTRPRLDQGILGIAAVSSASPGRSLTPVALRFQQWSRPTFEVTADGPVAAGIDGETATLEPPIRFSSRPLALRVRIARGAPGASPSTHVPRGLLPTVAELVRIALEAKSPAGDQVEKSREGSSDGHVRGGAARDPHPR